MSCSINSSNFIGAGPTSRPCQLILQQCLALTLRKSGANGQPSSDPGEFWMYDSGYLLFQSFLSSNSKCWWNKGLVTACKQLRYVGYVQHGVLLVGSKDACALELVRAAYARGVLKPPEGHIVQALGDIEDCLVTPCIQGQFTPLPEALCDVILELTTSGNDAGLESIRKCLSERFPNIQTPNHETVYDTLAQLMAERKIYNTSKGYFIVTPERRRSRSNSNGRCPSNSSRSTPSHQTNGIGSGSCIHSHQDDSIDEEVVETRRRMLLSEDELLVIAHGDMATLRDGHVTHQCVQTSLRDVICGGSPSDKVLYPRSSKRRSASFPVAPRNGTSPDRRRSTSTGRGGASGTALRLWGSARRLRRSASTRSLARDKQHNATMTSTDSSSGTESNGSPKKASLLSRLFRRSTKRNQPLGTFSAQFPPPEWFNSTAIHLHSIGTQTSVADMQQAQQEYYNCSNSTTTENEPQASSARSATLPRSHTNRHRRHLSNESNGLTTSYVDSRDQSPNPRRLSPMVMRNYNTNSLPRSPNHKARKSKTNLDPSPQNGHVLSKNHSTELASNRLETINSNKRTELPSERLSKALIDSRNRSMKQTLKNGDSRNSPEYRSMRDTLDRRQRFFMENRSMRDNKSTLERRPSIKTQQKTNEPQSPLESTAEIATSPDVTNLGSDGGDGSHQDSLDNGIFSGPSSLESHKTGSSNKSGMTSLTNSGPSSLESQKTVIPSSTNKNEVKIVKNETTRNSKKLSSLNKANMTKSNSFTLQVTTNKNGVSVSNYSGEQDDTTTTATINGTNTKIFVQNSPIRSVITFENGQHQENSHDYVIINNDTCDTKKTHNNESMKTQTGLREKTTIKNTNNHNDYEPTTILNNSNMTLNDVDISTMNNRKLSLQMPTTKDSLNYKNVLKNVPTSTYSNQTNSNPSSPIINFRDFTKNSFASNPPSPTKSFDSFSGSIGSVYYEKNTDDKKITRHSLDQTKLYPNGLLHDNTTNTLSCNKIQDKNTLGSEPNLCLDKIDREKTLTRDNVDVYDFPSLNDISFNFTSLAAQKILKGVSINSVDTLVELNMAANAEKQNNCDVQHTDFGIV